MIGLPFLQRRHLWRGVDVGYDHDLQAIQAHAETLPESDTRTYLLYLLGELAESRADLKHARRVLRRGEQAPKAAF